MLNIGWFSTGRGEGSRGLLNFVQKRLAETGANARISFAFSNRARGEAEGSDEYFALVDGYGIPLITHSSTEFRKQTSGRFSDHREEFDKQVTDKLAAQDADICVLAGYMLIVGGKMCRQYPLLNLHPALPDGPTGTWQEVVWELIGTGLPRPARWCTLPLRKWIEGPWFPMSLCLSPAQYSTIFGNLSSAKTWMR